MKELIVADKGNRVEHWGLECEHSSLDYCSNYCIDPSSGILRPGLNAVMGPTGSGKTTYVRTYMYDIEHRSI